MMSEFYIGYLPKSPKGIRRFLHRVVPGLGLLAVVIAGLLLAGQGPFAASAFEFGTVRHFEGVIVARPYPTLRVARPGVANAADSVSEMLLVAPGKHGADELVSHLDGQHMKLDGQLIYRDGTTMIEIAPESIHADHGSSSAARGDYADLGPVSLTGEIVDSKCYLGVMNPGSGKVHRDCASRCLSGGIPPIFVSAADGAQYLLVDRFNKAVPQDALREFIAESLTVRGELLRRGDTTLLAIDTAALRHSR
jgi:hypothetical protein